jgi:predicted dehydrogenase/diketogulonate reductase-like aldo/keto reductase
MRDISIPEKEEGMKQVQWGILGTGRIARTFAQALVNSRTGQPYAVASRSQESADNFARQHGTAQSYGSYEALLKDPEVAAVYISTPHPIHVEWIIKAARAGKHILCEKPLTLNYSEAMAAVEAARESGVFLMEAFMYRCHPQTARLVEIVRGGDLGEVRFIEATFSFKSPFDPESRLFSQSLGGGGILDVGCYCVSMARLIAGAARGMPFVEPVEVKGSAYIGKTSRVDEYAAAIMSFPGDIIAVLSTGVGLAQENRVQIYGTEGRLLVPSPWAPGRTAKMTLYRGREAEEITVEADRGVYALEADVAGERISEGQAPEMSWDDSLGNIASLDRWRDAVGLLYDSEKLDAERGPVGGAALNVSKAHNMRYGQVEGIAPPVSRLVLGVDYQKTAPRAFVLFDDFFERGGKCFDAACIYGGGKYEKMLGSWVRQRGVRDRVVIIDKGAHSPYCTPIHVVKQLDESLERLGLAKVDIYFLHRDNPEVPVGEFVDVLNEQKRLGRIGIFGGSNWSLERVRQANTYAEEKGLEGFTAVSNNFSLARMIEPVWEGCVHAWDRDYRLWLEETGTPLFPWSSQARGFFTERTDGVLAYLKGQIQGGPAGAREPDRFDRTAMLERLREGGADPGELELFRSWFSAGNLERRRRAIALAQKRNGHPIGVALAYVLSQPFPTFALIGPRTLRELRVSLEALDLLLSPEEMVWLNLET